MRSIVLALLCFAAAAAMASDPRGAAPPASASGSAFAVERMPGAPLEQVLKAFPSARETDERCLHDAVEKLRLFCTRFTARQGNLGYHLEFSKSARLIRSTEYAILPTSREAERVYRTRVDALSRAMGRGKASRSTPAEGLTEQRTSWTDKPQKGLRSGVVLLGKPDEPSMVLDYLETHDPKHF